MGREKLRRCKGLYHYFKAAVCSILASNTLLTAPHAGGRGGWVGWRGGGMGGGGTGFEARIEEITALKYYLT